MNVNKQNILIAGIFFLILIAISSCDYQEIGDADFPEEMIYLPAAGNGNYVINSLPVGDVDYRFQVNPGTNQLIVPLSAYRSGLNISSTFTVDISVDSDTIAALLAADTWGDDAVAVLPEGKYELESSVTMNPEERTASFALKIDLDYLTSNEAQNKIYALGVNISSDECASNEALSTVIILIYPEILHPEAGFSYRNGTESRQIRFTNASVYYVSSHWDFGDGNTSVEISPDHVYGAAGVYSVKLTTTGISGVISEKTVQIAIE